MDLVNPARLAPAKAEHLPIVKRIAEHAYAKYVERIGKPPGPMYDDYEGHLAQGNLHVLERGGEVVAVAVYWEESGALFLDNVAVLPDFQGTGVGSAFLVAIEDLAREKGIRHLDLYTNTKMVENVDLYKAAGFEITDHRTEEGFERVYMRKTVLGPETMREFLVASGGELVLEGLVRPPDGLQIRWNLGGFSVQSQRGSQPILAWVVRPGHVGWFGVRDVSIGYSKHAIERDPNLRGVLKDLVEEISAPCPGEVLDNRGVRVLAVAWRDAEQHLDHIIDLLQHTSAQVAR